MYAELVVNIEAPLEGTFHYQIPRDLAGSLKIGHLVETFPLSKINEVFRNTLEHKYNKRSVLVPDFE